jgi:hypothetical protein
MLGSPLVEDVPMTSFRVLIWVLGAVLLAASIPADLQAQPTTKAYAPEDLRRLNVPDRVRVIEREYAEQSRGRRIPDDQLEFYLDQVDSGWSFSRIKQDIAESLRGGATWHPGTPGWQAREVICTSEDYRRRECIKPFRGPAVLSEQFSAVRCVEGQSWGQTRDRIWVDRGCRGRFREDPRPVAPILPPSMEGVVCESREGRRRRCPTPFRGPAQIAEQYSQAACIQGETWGSTPGEVWVTRGCRALFVEARGRPGRPGLPGMPGIDYNVTCTSDGGYRACAWNRSMGRPYIIEQMSRAPCVEGRSWGYADGNIWVDRGCRARFGAR